MKILVNERRVTLFDADRTIVAYITTCVTVYKVTARVSGYWYPYLLDVSFKRKAYPSLESLYEQIISLSH